GRGFDARGRIEAGRCHFDPEGRACDPFDARARRGVFHDSNGRSTCRVAVPLKSVEHDPYLLSRPAIVATSLAGSPFVRVDAAGVQFPHVMRPPSPQTMAPTSVRAGAEFFLGWVWNVGGFCIHSSEGLIDMKNDRDECLSGQKVVSYLSGELRDDEKAEVERHVDECRLCAGA